MTDPSSDDKLRGMTRIRDSMRGLLCLVDRQGGFITFTDAEYDAVQERYGGIAKISVQEVEPGRISIRLLPGDASDREP
jgi:hypothetical protein